MNEDNSVPNPEAIEQDTTGQKLAFEWYRYEYGSERDEYSDREVADVAYQATATIIEPQPGMVVQEERRTVVRWRQEHQGQNYVVIKRNAGYVALRTDVVVGPREAARVELRAVTLDGPEPALAWEVYTQSPQGTWEPVEGQHLRARTAPAQQWLEEMENVVLPKLIAQRTDLVAQYHKATELTPAAGQPHDRPLNYDAALALARNAILECNCDEVHSVAYTAELQRNSATTRLREHAEAGQRLGLSIYAPWIGIPHWRKTLRYRGRLKRATDDWTHARAKVRHLQQTADTPKVRESIGQGAKDLLAAQKLKREADRAVRKVAEAEQLVAYLRQHQGALVTLDQTVIQGRRAQTVPKPQASEPLARRLSLAPKIRV